MMAPASLAFADEYADNQDYNYYDPYYYVENWEITDFHSDIQLEKNGTVKITEIINADFTNEAHRGFLRQIPYKYYNTWYDSYDAKLNFIKATNEKGEVWKTRAYKEYEYLNIEILTQDDSQLFGPANYFISYEGKNVIGRFEDHEEFYWNINGTEWPVSSGIVSATVSLPKQLDEKDIQADCFTGEYGFKEKNCSWEIIGGKRVKFTTTKELKAYENLSIVIGMPKGTIDPLPLYTRIFWAILEYAQIGIIPGTFIFMFILWYKRGRDDQSVPDTIMPHYKAPKDLSPTETGTLIDERINTKDISATIIDFAIKGYIKINEIDKDFELELLKPYKTEKEFEELIMKGIFTNNAKGEKILISSLNNKFYTHIPAINKSVMKEMEKNDFFTKDPSKVRSFYTTIGSTILGIQFFIAGLLNPITFFSLIGAGIIIIIFGQFMGQKTKKGTKAYYQLKGLYEYINTAEKDRLKFQEENNIMFEKLLPYAMAFGIAKKWAKAFDGIITTPPTWYNSNHRWDSATPFRMTYLSSQLGNLGNKFSNYAVSKPQSTSRGSGWRSGGGGSWSGGSGFSSGGGFSGGGFGGGGGRGL